MNKTVSVTINGEEFTYELTEPMDVAQTLTVFEVQLKQAGWSQDQATYFGRIAHAFMFFTDLGSCIINYNKEYHETHIEK